MYLSFESLHRPEAAAAAFPPATLERLRGVKGIWDPDDVFSQNFDVSQAGAATGDQAPAGAASPG